ncbi:hypothetical protein EIN_495440 [Entamoeba invadens IP1]|uniref:TLDc domain-containing protein n=1 Tax=Entamoeba invadens IP1 TaxID=370355 RepID=A0A0A1TZQ0_ENTIV|nr:hypothetical protein EIN_495440 [Entamoeba invadens IP1]ELP87089.1 hypothetical protein EIN_495440 [Entamoeba invadens IP1]|eukprot:XP_004253860.1 hypothetical protein EIN_495440 [Entamoeba invadens IP1]
MESTNETSQEETCGYYLVDAIRRWTGWMTPIVLFDSDNDCITSFKNRVMHHPNLYFINIDEYNNTFGCFTERPVNTTDNYTSSTNHFLFSIHSKGSYTSPTRFYPKEGKIGGVCIHSDSNDGVYGIGYNGFGFSCCNIYNPGTKKTWCNHLDHTYNNISDETFTCRPWAYPNYQRYRINRILVVEMI